MAPDKPRQKSFPPGVSLTALGTDASKAAPGERSKHEAPSSNRDRHSSPVPVGLPPPSPSSRASHRCPCPCQAVVSCRSMGRGDARPVRSFRRPARPHRRCIAAPLSFPVCALEGVVETNFTTPHVGQMPSSCADGPGTSVWPPSDWKRG